MTKELIEENGFYTLWFHPDDGIVHHKFHKFIYGDTFRACLNRGTALLKERGASKWLSDDRKNSVITPDDSEWGVYDWLPRTIEAGWRYWAIVMPEGVTGRLKMESIIVDTAKSGLIIETFTDDDYAMDWLRTFE